MLAVVTLKPDEQGRNYRVPTDQDYAAVWRAHQELMRVATNPATNTWNPVPDEPLPPIGTLGFRVQRYGMLQWGDLFSARQKVGHKSVTEIIKRMTSGLQGEFADSIRELLGLIVDRLVDKCAANVYWHDSREFVDHVFARQALIVHWNTAEAPIISDVGFGGALEWIAKYIESAPVLQPGQVQIEDASRPSLPNESSTVWFTDPPYYDAIPYSDLADYFLVWLKRALPGHRLLGDPFDPANPLSPKQQEVVQDETKIVNGKPKDRSFFEETMARVFAEGRRVLREDGIASVVFAHKTTEGWEALLSGMIRGGWTISGSWPISTEMATRLRARDSAALATSVHLVCRPRPENAPIGDWGQVLRELPDRVTSWMDRLQSEGVRGADLVFACIGPALEIFSRFCRVETAEGTEVTLADYLEKVWEVVGRTALEQILGKHSSSQYGAGSGALEEDARLTALFLWTLQSTRNQSNGNRANGAPQEELDFEEADDDEDDAPRKKKPKGLSLIFDVVRRFAQPLGIHLPEWEGRIIEIEKGVVRLLPVPERAKQLFGESGTEVVATELERSSRMVGIQLKLFPEWNRGITPQPAGQGRRRPRIAPMTAGGALQPQPEATTLDRIHAAMLLQKSGHANALRTLLKSEVERSPGFLRLANALSALYPTGSEEKRLLDAMLLAVPK